MTLTDVGMYFLDKRVERHRLVTVADSAPVRLRSGRGKSEKVHVVPAEEQEGDTCSALCGGRTERQNYPPVVKPWRWTSDDVDCGACLKVIRDAVGRGKIAFATDEMMTTRRKEAVDAMYARLREISPVVPSDMLGRLAASRRPARVGTSGATCVHLVEHAECGRSACGVRPDRGGNQWRWTDEGLSCANCLYFLVADLSDKARRAALVRTRGVIPSGTGGSFAANGASEAAGDAWYAAGCPSVASMALEELKPREHYPQCVLDGNPYRLDLATARCSCYDDDEQDEVDTDVEP
jgi:hypothetical protein